MSNIGGNMGLGKANIEQQLRILQQRAKELQSGSVSQPKAASFETAIAENVSELNKSVSASENITHDAIKGDLDFHEVAGRIKEAKLSFNFAMQVRNKLIDSYREVMRMSV